MKISTAQYTDIGGRENNEDSFGVFDMQNGKLCIIADGLGGHVRGELASKAALEVIRQNVVGELSEQCMKDAMEKANGEVLRLAGKDKMNTTLSVLWLQDGQALAASVGDTRIYQFRKGQIIFQTRDHSLAQLDVLMGGRYREIRRNPDRNKLVRVVGMPEGFEADITRFEYQQGDSFLLCSDGFWEDIAENEMLQTRSRAESADAWLRAMREILAQRLTRYSDNNTAVAVIVS